MTDTPMTNLPGWDADWDAAFAPFAVGGRRAARVVAVHKETAITRAAQGEDRAAIVTGRFRHEALAASDYPAVGDWVALEPDQSDTGSDGPAVIAAIAALRVPFTISCWDCSPDQREDTDSGTSSGAER